MTVYAKWHLITHYFGNLEWTEELINNSKIEIFPNSQFLDVLKQECKIVLTYNEIPYEMDNLNYMTILSIVLTK